ncbi:MAG: alkane 1-monooxygenase [Candidatus Neomarinimicrobiota bacterium]|tara:strand:+ start:3904 stop:5061 length:1158 start_codon:yes stop_codon:yes gene_type:complete
MKYLKYFISPATLVVALFFILKGAYYPTAFLIGFSLFIILGDYFIKENLLEQLYKYPFLLNLPMYLNLPLLFVFISVSIFSLSNESSILLTSILSPSSYSKLEAINASFTFVDLVSLVFLSGLFIGIMGTVPGHELVHRVKSKLDMFFGNWLLAFSWDCTFAVEHVYGHHRNVATSIDPATGKRGENIYKFILKAMFIEHRDAWRIEVNRLRLAKKFPVSFNNRMLIGYARSMFLTFLAFLIGGVSGIWSFLIIAFIAKSLLELINFAEHYGLVRVVGEPVQPRHSWNSNATLSSLYLFNVTRHSSHHEKSHLKFWELKTYENSPTMPQGYLTMIYLGLIAPFLFHRVMARKLVEWDQKFANDSERELAKKQNKISGIPLLVNSA